ncbi:MAG: hypothetical protein U0793_08075 [Gemmataceae bacterium]
MRPACFSPPVRFGLALASGVTLFAILSHFVLLPLHEHDAWQGLLGYLQGADFLLQAPGLWLAQKLRPPRRPPHRPRRLALRPGL